MFDKHKNDNELNKWNRNLYRPCPDNVVTIDWSKFNSTPKLDDKPLRKLIRSQITPFNPDAGNVYNIQDNDLVEINKVTPANHRKVVSLPLASLTEAEKRHHAQVTYEMCQRLADCWNCPLDKNVTPDSIYWMYEIFCWQCPKTGIHHSWKTPLSIEFIQPAWLQGKIAIQNMKPVYNGFLPGQYAWAHSNRKVDNMPIAA